MPDSHEHAAAYRPARISRHVWETTEPRYGRKVVLKEETYEQHILQPSESGREGHVELAGMADRLRRQVENPKYILKDPEKGTREHFVDIWHFQDLGQIKIVKVVVDFETDPGIVITAHIAKRIRSSDEVVLYERP